MVSATVQVQYNEARRWLPDEIIVNGAALFYGIKMMEQSADTHLAQRMIDATTGFRGATMISQDRLMELVIDKLFLGLIAGTLIAAFGYWLNRRLKERDREYERSRSATNIRVAAATNAVERVLSAGDDILAELGTLSGDIYTLKHAAERLNRAAQSPRPEVADDISEDDAWAAHAETLQARVETVLASTRFASQTHRITEAIRQKFPEWAMRVLVWEQEQLKGGTEYDTLPIHKQITAGDMKGDLSRLLIRMCLAHEAIAKLQGPAARLHAAVEDAAVLLAEDDPKALKELQVLFREPVARMTKALLDVQEQPDLNGGLLRDLIYTSRSSVLYQLIHRTIHLNRAHD